MLETLGDIVSLISDFIDDSGDPELHLAGVYWTKANVKPESIESEIQPSNNLLISKDIKVWYATYRTYLNHRNEVQSYDWYFSDLIPSSQIEEYINNVIENHQKTINNHV